MERGWGISAVTAGLALGEYSCALAGEPRPEPARTIVPASLPKSRRVTFVINASCRTRWPGFFGLVSRFSGPERVCKYPMHHADRQGTPWLASCDSLSEKPSLQLCGGDAHQIVGGFGECDLVCALRKPPLLALPSNRASRRGSAV